MLISPEYLELQKELHSRGDYGVSARKWTKRVNELAEVLSVRSLLDYGCGQGLLSRQLPVTFDRIYQVREYDPAVLGKSSPPEYADLVYCGDVLEHVEPRFLEAVLDDLKRLARVAVFLMIATRPAMKYLADGRNAHLIVEPAFWWLRRLQERWITNEFSGNAGEFMFIGMTR